MKSITELTPEHALEAAQQTGLAFESAGVADWGIFVRGYSEEKMMGYYFSFRFEGGICHSGIAGILTPNIHKVIDYLRAKGYDFGK